MELSGMNIIALLIIVVLIISISLAVISLIGLDLQRTVPKQIQETYTKLVISLFQKSPYNVCEALSGKQISYQEFQNLLLAAHNGQCGDIHASVTLSRSYSKDEIEQVAKINAIADDGKLIYYREAVPFGVGGLIIQGNPGYFPLKKWDTIDVWSAGKPTADTMINVTEQGCDPYDEICQAGCTYKKICDPVCDDGKKHDITCNIACIDTAGDGIDIKDMEARVAANKCNPDCYANRTNPFKAYDPGCVWKFKEQRDDICDPNSNGVIDGVCDPDCISTKNICDFDCNGTSYAGNPLVDANGAPLKDEKCLVCDGKCNGWCSPACNKNAVEGMPGYDPDCRKEVVHNFWCSGDGLCENDKGENCENSADCKQICDDQNLACCPKSSDSDYAGCTASKDLKEGNICSCSNQCGQLKCDETGHCCPEGKTWNGTSCEFKYTFTLLFVQLNGNVPDFNSRAESSKNGFVEKTYLSNCPEKVKALVVSDKICNVPDQSSVCGSSGQAVVDDTDRKIKECASSWGYTNWQKIVGFLPSSFVCTVSGGGILGYARGYYAETVIVSQYSYVITTEHELGHAFGLCDEAYGNVPCSGCSSGTCGEGTSYCCPNAPHCGENCLMCAGSGMTHFASQDYTHLTNELQNYCS